MANQFTGFTAQGLQFLTDVRQHDSKEWFDNNRHIYDEQVIKPMRLLIEQLTQRMLMIDELFEVRPAVGKTISRIHRDTRFSHDKSRYRDLVWLTFKRPSKEWKAAPAFFFEVSHSFYRYGMGYCEADRGTMDLFRKLVDKDHKSFLKVVSNYKEPFEIVGEEYKRPLVKELDPKIAKWYNRKGLAVIKTSNNVGSLFSPDFAYQLEKDFGALEPLYHYLREVDKMKPRDNFA